MGGWVGRDFPCESQQALTKGWTLTKHHHIIDVKKIATNSILNTMKDKKLRSLRENTPQGLLFFGLPGTGTS